MVKDVVKVLLTKYDPKTMTIELPNAFEHLKGQDANFEMVTSNTIQPIKLSYSHNIVARSIATIFVNTDCNGLQYIIAEEKGESMQKLFEEVLEYNEV